MPAVHVGRWCAGEKQRVNEDKYRSLYDNTPVMMHSIDQDGHLISVSNLWLETLGYERAEVLGRRSTEFLTPRSRQYAQEVVLPAFFRTGHCKDIHYQFVRRDGGIVDVLLSAIAERDDTGKIVRSLAVLTDVSERIRAEEQLRWMASIVESTGEAVFSVGLDRRVTSWNRGAEKVFGYGADEMIGRPIAPTIPPDRADEAAALADRVLRGEVVGEIETERLRKDGSRIPVALTVSPVIGEKAAVVGIASIARDISLRKGIEAALRESEQRFRDFADTASDWLWETGPDHRFTFVSAPFRVLEIDRAARLGVRRVDVADDLAEEPEKWRKHLTILERHEPFRNFIYRTRRSGGNIGYVLTSGKPRFDAAGQFLGYRGSARDITSSVRADEALLASEQRFRDFAETESDWFWETGPDHRMSWMTERPGAGGIDPTRRVGKQRWEYATDVEEEPEKWRKHRAMLDQRLPFRDFVFRIRSPQGIDRHVSTSGKPVFARDGSFLGYRGVGRDVTDAVRAERALREGEERLQLAIEAGEMGTCDYDISRNVVQWSSRLMAVFGFPEVQGTTTMEGTLEYVHPDDRATVEKAFAVAIETKDRYHSEFRINSAEGDHWLASHGIVVTDAAGKPVRMVGVVRDISARKHAELRQKLLLDELNHRVKNTLLTVQSVAMQMAREAGSPELFYQAFKARLIALSNAHDLLTRGAWQGASLRDLVQQTLAPYAQEGEERFEIAGPEIWLKPNVAVGLAMAFQELATNAAKHGALSTGRGRIAVNWRGGQPGSDMIEIKWSEHGGPSVKPPRRRGFGSRLLERGLAYEFKAEVRLDFVPGGLQCVMRLPA
jgi:PAS domain S-box-containing protein